MIAFFVAIIVLYSLFGYSTGLWHLWVGYKKTKTQDDFNLMMFWSILYIPSLIYMLIWGI